MKLLSKRQDDRDLVGHRIGNALVVRPKNLLRDEIRDLALGIAADPDHELVIVDLPVDSSFTLWESAAKLLPRKRRGLRLVISGRSRETMTLAGQWLSERLNRTVIAADGSVMCGVDGSLFVDSGWGTGWVRFQPGKAPQPDGKRFPRPFWTEASPLVEVMPTSAGAVAEPLPGGVWLRPRGPESVLRHHRERLIESLPCQPDTCVVVLGCPGALPISTYDITRFWSWLPAEMRAQLRLVKLGPVKLSYDIPYGQVLADELQEQVTCYTGLPVGSRVDPDVYTVRPDGTLGWRTFAEEMTYHPAQGGAVRPPALLTYRDPVVGVEEVAPAVYRYAPNVVLEVVQSGLWVRPDQELPHAPVVRSTLPDATRHLVLFEDSHGDVLRQLAEDVLGQLEPATQYLSGLTRANSLVRGRIEVVGGGKAMAALESGPVPYTADVVAEPPAAGTPGESWSADIAGVRLESVLPDVESPLSAPGAPAPSQAQWAVDYEASQAKPSSPVAPPAEAASAGGTVAEDHVVAGPPQSGAPGETTARTESPAGSPVPVSEIAAPAAPAESPHLGQVLPVAGFMATDAPDVAGFAPSKPHREPSAAQPAAPAPPQPVTPAPREQPAAASGASVSVQPTPSSGAAALVPKRGLEEERAWLRRTLSREYAAVANSVSRVLSEHPGFQGAIERSAGVLNDAVAIRLYLSGEGDGVDLSLRSGVAGPHVPFARCVVSGLSRLPSHRGVSVFGASPTEQEWELYRSRKYLTDWGFVNALSSPCANQRREHDVDVVLWSMTARRTKLLEPDRNPIPDRVLFVPGTSFKVLDLVEPGEGTRGQVLLRELAAGEIDESGRVDSNRAALDELALNSLRRFVDSWADAKHEKRTSDAVASRFGLLPGLVRLKEEGR
ncbi:hypothetical protein [Lentzea sp. NPDC059081]|uniref:hypothetical protein n=1 Tax=Lentzea sp. NPDC059081 TaxID=3346719 RepID=UPI0036BF0C15